MKYGTKWIAWPLLVFLLLSAVPAGYGEEAVGGEALPVTVAEKEEWAVNSDGTVNFDSFVRYPVFIAEDEALSPAIDRVNQAIQEKARIPDYLQLLSTVGAGGAGLKMDYELGLYYSVALEPAFRVSVYDWYVSILFSAEGKMLSGRPSQIYYPMTFDLRTGEEIPFDRLFTDPDGAKAYIESVLEEEVEPSLSTYLENSQLFPVPYDRFFLDGWGHILIAYENSQLSFLSGTSGAVSFRCSELLDWLDVGQDGVVAHLPYWAINADRTEEENAQAVWAALKNGFLILSNYAEAQVGVSLPPLLSFLRPAADSGYYPGGAYYEVENPHFRGTLLLTDEAGETLTGLLSSRVDLPGIQTGKTPLEEAERFLGGEPGARLPLDEAAAEIYRVCPGTAAVYPLDGYHHPLALTLYADENGIVQYVKLSLQ